MALFITFLAGISVVLGAVVVKFARNPERVNHWSCALAFGAMIALSLFDLGPETLELAEEGGALIPVALVAAGALVLVVFDRFIPDHDGKEAHEHHASAEKLEAHIGLITLLAIVLHNIVEGMTVYALSLSDPQAGASYAFGIALHNIPMGMLIFSALRGEKTSVKVGAIAGALVSTLLGGIIMMLVSAYVSEQVMEMLTCIALGMIIYIVLAELLPHLLRERPAIISVAGAAIGFALVLVASIWG